MAKYKLRLAKPSDAKEIANLHYSIREQGAPGIFAMMGKPFLKKYYKIVLNDPNEVVICAENEKGQIVGFNSSTLDAKAQMDNLRRKRVQLAFAAFTSILANPKLIKPLFDRYKSMAHFFPDQIFCVGRSPGGILGLEGSRKRPGRQCGNEHGLQSCIKGFGGKRSFL